MKKIAVMLNPSSNQGKAKQQGEKVVELLELSPFEVVTILENDGEACLSRARDLVAEGDIEAVIAVGGDGTVHMAVEAIGTAGIPLGVIAIGSGNDTAREFGLPIHGIEASVNQVIDALLASRTRKVDMLEISDATHTSYAMAVVSAGFDAGVNHLYNKLSWPNGTFRYARALLKASRGWNPYGIRIEIDGTKAAEGAVSILSIANTRYYGGGMTIAPNARPDDGELEIVIAPAVPRLYLLAVFPLVYFGKLDLASKVHTYRGREVRISDAPVQGSKAPAAMADGEIVGELPLTVRCLPGTLNVLV